MLRPIMGGLYDADPANADGYVAYQLNEKHGGALWHTVGTCLPRSALENLDQFRLRMEQGLEHYPGGSFNAVSIPKDGEVTVYVRIPASFSKDEFMALVAVFKQHLRELQMVIRPMDCPIGPRLVGCEEA